MNYVSWGCAARFCNWLHNGQPTTGVQDLTTTEDGSYFLNGATSEADLMAVVREPDATWVLPTEDEWYKAAYHKNDGVTDHYWPYPTASDDVPSNDLVDPDPGNHATFMIPGYPDDDYTIGPPYYRTPVGAHENSSSPYGTYDQGGNVLEWCETVISMTRLVRGGWYSANEWYMSAPVRIQDWYFPSYYHSHVGFRAAHVGGPAPCGGDLNCDGTIDFGDINPFVLYLSSFASWQGTYVDCNPVNGDINGDGSYGQGSFGDISPFVALIAQCASGCACPGPVSCP